MFTEKQKAELKVKRERTLKKIPFGFEGGQELQNILDKGAATPGEMEILRARRSCLTEEQLEQFGIDEETPEAPKEEVSEEEEAPKEETAKEKKARIKAEKEEAKAAAKAAKKKK